jgi:hypothetical protein
LGLFRQCCIFCCKHGFWDCSDSVVFFVFHAIIYIYSWLSLSRTRLTQIFSWVEFLSKSRTSLCINIYNLTPVESNSDESKFLSQPRSRQWESTVNVNNSMKNKKYNTVGTVPKSMFTTKNTTLSKQSQNPCLQQKIQHCRNSPKINVYNKKYNTVGTVPKSMFTTKNTTLSEQTQNQCLQQNIQHCRNSPKIHVPTVLYFLL